jgi:hypothetical protein
MGFWGMLEGSGGGGTIWEELSQDLGGKWVEDFLISVFVFFFQGKAMGFLGQIMW